MVSNINSFKNKIQNTNYRLKTVECTEACKNILKNIPLFVLFISITTCVFYLLNLLLPSISFYLSNVPFYLVFQFQLWRLFTTTLITTKILHIIFAFLIWIRESSNLEKTMGTLKYMFTFIINSTLIQVIHTMIMLIIYLITGKQELMTMNMNMEQVENSGLWPVIIAEITVLCFANSNNPVRILSLPCEIKAKFYPIILFVFFIILNQFQIQVDLIVGIIYAILHHYILRNRIFISDGFVLKCEGFFLFRWLRYVPGFIPCGNVLPVPTSSNQTVSDVVISSSATESENNNNFKAFRGKGISIGGSLGSSTGEYHDLNLENSTQISN